MGNVIITLVIKSNMVVPISGPRARTFAPAFLRRAPAAHHKYIMIHPPPFVNPHYRLFVWLSPFFIWLSVFRMVVCFCLWLCSFRFCVWLSFSVKMIAWYGCPFSGLGLQKSILFPAYGCHRSGFRLSQSGLLVPAYGCHRGLLVRGMGRIRSPGIYSASAAFQGT